MKNAETCAIWHDSKDSAAATQASRVLSGPEKGATPAQFQMPVRIQGRWCCAEMVEHSVLRSVRSQLKDGTCIVGPAAFGCAVQPGIRSERDFVQRPASI